MPGPECVRLGAGQSSLSPLAAGHVALDAEVERGERSARRIERRVAEWLGEGGTKVASLPLIKPLAYRLIGAATAHTRKENRPLLPNPGEVQKASEPVRTDSPTAPMPPDQNPSNQTTQNPCGFSSSQESHLQSKMIRQLWQVLLQPRSQAAANRFHGGYECVLTAQQIASHSESAVEA